MIKKTKLWKTASGKKIRICDMTDSHLLNTIKFLEKHADKARQQIINDFYTLGCIFTGEAASDDIGDKIARLEEESVFGREDGEDHGLIALMDLGILPILIVVKSSF